MVFKILPCLTATLAPFALATLIGPAAAHHLQPADADDVAEGEPNQRYNQTEEAFIRTPPGAATPGQPRRASGPQTGLLTVSVTDRATGKRSACRMNIVGPEGNYYEPDDQRLAPYGSRQAGCHVHDETHAPSRYYGWYFYTDGQCEVRVPAGKIRIEVWKGYEFRPRQRVVEISAGSRKSVAIEVERTAAMEETGYYSGDTHIHLNRRDERDEQIALDLAAAEDIRYAFLLCMNDPPAYTGRMELQTWPQLRGFGTTSVLQRDGYGIASAQEYRTKTYGHICLLMHNQLVLSGATVEPNNWPVFGLVGQRTRALGGYSFHAHGGYSREIYADYVQHATDGVELLQMAHYRGIGLSGWYRMLNIGYRFPGLAGSDFPYTRALGDCRTYVYAGERPSFAAWTKAAAEGRSFFTTGPLLLLEVEGRRPGDTIEVDQNRPPRQLAVSVKVRCEVTGMDHVDLIVNGRPRERWPIPRNDHNRGKWHVFSATVPANQPQWIAARVTGASATGRADAEAHTNPVYIEIDGQKPFNAPDRDWLVDQLDGQLQALEEREFTEKPQAVEFFRKSRQQLLDLP